MSLSPLHLIDAHPWKRVGFATYAVSLTFFEAVILDRLVRGGASQALILADVHGVKAALSEQGAQRVGKDYDVEPVVVDGGVFHPKVTVLANGTECHLLVGSGNLTFNGWGGNCEILEHLHAGFAPDAIVDAAGFFEELNATGRVRHSARAQCAGLADDLRGAVTGRAGDGSIRFVHNLNVSLEDQIAEFVEDLGGAKRLVTMAPYYDGGTAVDSLCRRLDLAELFVHAHKHGCVEGLGAQNWPRGGKSRVSAVRLDVFDKKESRRLHAKAFEILCKRGRIVVSGSANGTTAALGVNHNVEACVVRLQRRRAQGWGYKTAEPLDPAPAVDAEEEAEGQSTGVLRAALDADQLTGEVLTPRMTGSATIFMLAGTGPERLAETTLSSGGRFSVSAPLLEDRSWTGGRLVIRVHDARGRQAEGFVSVVSFGDITRRAGLLGRRLFAMLGGTETPADVAAIMSWFYEDPDRLASAKPPADISGAGGAKSGEHDELIPVAALSQQYTAGALAAMAGLPSAQRSWSRFMDQVFAAFRTARVPFSQTAAGGVGDDDDDDDAATAGSADNDTVPVHDPAIEKSLIVFERLFDLLTQPDGSERHALIAFDLTQYVCVRLRPDAAEAQSWIERLIRVLIYTDVPEDRRADVAAAVLVLAALAPGIPAYRWARHCLLRLHIDLDGAPPAPEGVRGFATLLPQQMSFADLWPHLQAIRTFEEQVRAYLRALDNGIASECDYPDLRHEARDEWPTLEAAVTSEKMRTRLVFAPRETDACPRCFIRLPAAAAARLQAIGIASAKGCCSRVVIWAGD